eukprot:Platyproteum_vivax@DN16020_c0_g1_i1.p1
MNKYSWGTHCTWLNFWINRLWNIQTQTTDKRTGKETIPWNSNHVSEDAISQAFPLSQDADSLPERTAETDVAFFNAAKKIAAFETHVRPTLEDSMTIMRAAFPEQYLQDQISAELEH